MPPRGQRLPRSGFPALARGKRFASAHFTLSIAPALLGSDGRAVIVPKQVAKLSVERHLLKRRIMSVIRLWYTPGRALAVYAKAGSLALPFSLLKEELTELFSRL